MNRFIFTVFGIAVGATISGLFGNFAYGIIGGGLAGLAIDIYRMIKDKKQGGQEGKTVVPDDYQVPKNINSRMRDNREVSNTPPRGFRKEEKKEDAE